MDVEWKTKETDENGDIYKVYANTGLYDIDIYLPQWHDKVSYGWCVDMIGGSGAEGTALTLEEAQAAALDFVRSEVAELAKGFGLFVELDQGWISVDERLPEKSGWMLIFESGLIQNAHYESSNGVWIVPHLIGYRRKTVTHWRPLPPPPDDEEVTT